MPNQATLYWPASTANASNIVSKQNLEGNVWSTHTNRNIKNYKPSQRTIGFVTEFRYLWPIKVGIRPKYRLDSGGQRTVSQMQLRIEDI